MSTPHLLETVEKYLQVEKRYERAWLTGHELPRDELAGLEHELRDELARAKAHAGQSTFRRILVAVDNNPRAAWVLHTAAALAAVVEGAAIRVVHVVDPSFAVNNEYGIADTTLVREMRDNADRFLSALTAEVPEAADIVIRDGSPGEEILDEARRFQADVIVVASPAHGQFVELLTGSADEYLMRHAACPILTVGHEPSHLTPDIAQAKYDASI